MPDFRELIRRHLPPLPVRPEREAEIVDELAQLLEDYAADAHGGRLPQGAELDAWVRTQIPEWTALARQIGRNELSAARRATGASPSTNRLIARSRSGRGAIVGALWNEGRFALRMLAKDPSFTGLVVVTLALAIGLNTAIFSVINAALLRPLPVEAPEELVNVYTSVPEAFPSHEPMSYPDFESLRQARSFSGVAAYAYTPLILGWGDETRMGYGELASGEYFDVLGIRPAVGRVLTADDDRRGDPRAVAVLSHRAWQRRFGADPAVVGAEIRVNGQWLTVVGVAPPGFTTLFRGMAPEIWLPFGLGPRLHAIGPRAPGEDSREPGRLDDRDRRWHWVTARLAPGVDVESAASEVNLLAARLAEAHPGTNEDRAFSLVPTDQVRILPGVDTVVRAASLVVMGLVGLVLLIACANLANMLLSRAAMRRKEIATRLALGASRSQIVRLLLIESLALAALGGGLGLLLAAASNRVLESLPLPVPMDVTLGLAVDVRVLAFTFAVSTLTAVLFGLVPALEATRTNLVEAMHEGARGGSGSRRQRFLRHGLVVGQVGVSLLLLICAGLTVRSLGNAHRIDPGFDPDGLVVGRYSPSLQGCTEVRSRELYRELRERLEALPEIEAVGYASHLPLSFAANIDEFVPDDRASAEDQDWSTVDLAFVDAGYFRAMGIPILRGRSFAERDGPESPGVVVVNQTLAERLWPGEDPLGKLLRRRSQDRRYEVIGVARSGKYRTLGEAPRPFLYALTAQHRSTDRMLVARAGDGAPAAIRAIRRISREIDDTMVVSGLQTVESAISGSLLLPRTGAILFALFGILGLILASVGVYGVISYVVSQRTREIGIRMAMGANRGSILVLIVRQGLWLTGAGLGLGLAAALVTTRSLAAILYGISATDAVTFVGISSILALVALAASYVPARRATRVDPMVALRID